jgi:cytochrome c1
VTPDQTRASADAPPFKTIAKRSEEALDRLPFFLADPAHMKPGTKMPNFNLSRQAIADLVAYIRSLKP